jgi:acyl-CoA hydrolase
MSIKGDFFVMAKSVAESKTTLTEFALPNDANTHGDVLGGKVMHLMDLTAAMTAYRHCRKPVLTISVDSLRFRHPVRIGSLMIFESVATRSFNTSMEIFVEVHSEDVLTGERVKTCSGFLTFVAIDENGRPSAIPRLEPENKIEKERFEAALKRRELRLQMKND